MKTKTIILILSIVLHYNLSGQTAKDTVTISGHVTDYEGNPIKNCSVMWLDTNFDEIEGLSVKTDNYGFYKIRIPKGKYKSMGAIDMDTYPHTAKRGLPEADQRLEFWGWNFIADRDTTLDIRYHRMEAYGLHVFEIPGGMPAFQIFVRPMSLSRFFQLGKTKVQHKDNVSNIKQEAISEQAEALRLAPPLDKVKLTVWIDGEEVPLLMKQDIKEYFEADEWGNAYLLTVDRPKKVTSRPYRVIKIELTDLENGDRGEAIYYMEKENYIR